MGIFISLHVAENTTKEEWEPVYEESIKLVKAFHLMDSEVVEVFGKRLFCAIPTEEKEENGDMCWSTYGDYVSMLTAEEQFLFRDLHCLSADQIEDKSYDPLISIASQHSVLDWEDDRCNNSFSFWNNKTQGEPYHMYLLAIGCMIEARLGEKAGISGDITIGQCREAVRLANKYLDKPIDLPVRCKLQELYERVRKLPVTEEEVLNVFECLYIGVKDKHYGEFVRKNFSAKERGYFWTERFKNCEIGSLGFSSGIKKYLNRGNDLGELCKIVSYKDEEGKEQYENFVKEIMKTKMFQKEKDLRDCLEIQHEEQAPYSIYTLIAQFAFAGAHNQNVDYYMPLEEIKKVLVRHIGSHCDVSKVISDYMRENEADTEEPSTTLNDFMDKFVEIKQEEAEKYDICKPHDFIFYKQGDKITPKLEEGCLDYLKFYKETCEEESFAELMGAAYETKCAFLISRNKYILLMKHRWFEIFEEIKTSPECFKRYYPMVRVIPNDHTKWVVYAYVTNEDFYKYFEKRLEGV